MSQNNQRATIVGVVKKACECLQRQLPEQVIFVVQVSSEKYEVCLLQFDVNPNALQRRLVATATSADDAAALIAFLPPCEFHLLDYSSISVERINVRKCAVVDPMARTSLQYREIAKRYIEFEYIPN